MESDHTRLDQAFYVLVATASPDDQFLLAQSLRGSLPTIQLSYATTAEQTKQCLANQAIEYYNFPRLLILDLQIAERQLSWQLLEQIRFAYPSLPIVLTSLDQRLETIQQAYNSKVNAFVGKAMDWNRWKERLDDLAHYWLEIVTLPRQPPSEP